MSCALTGAGKPERTGSPEGGQIAVQQQLEQLNREADRLATQLEEARAAWLKHREDKDLKDVYNDLKANATRLDGRRKALEAKLSGAGRCACVSIASRMLRAVCLSPGITRLTA